MASDTKNKGNSSRLSALYASREAGPPDDFYGDGIRDADAGIQRNVFLRIADGLLRGPWHQIVSIAAIAGLCYIARKLIENDKEPLGTGILLSVVAAMIMVLFIAVLAQLLGYRDHHERKEKKRE